MTDLRIGLVGAGMVAGHHLAAWAACAGARIVGVADPDPSRAAARAAEAGVPAFASLEAMRSVLRLDAVDIAAPVPGHAALVMEAAEAGLPALCQKPLCPTGDEARALVRALPSGARVMVHENWRWRPTYRALRAELDHMPRPSSFEMRVESSGLLPAPDGTLPALVRQPFFAGMPRLLVLEILIHHLDTLTFLLGPVEIVAARIERRCPAVLGEDKAEIGLTAGGVPGRLTGDLMVSGAPAMPVDRLSLDGPVPARIDDWSLQVGAAAPRHWDAAAGYEASYRGAVEHFTARLTDGGEFETPIGAGLAQLDAVESVYALARI